jgi:REP element-mobilizing transposase RayT
MLQDRPRLRSFDYIGCYRYFLTFCTAGRHRAFVAPPTVDSVLTQILRAATGDRFEIPAYCFMPDHAHFLVHGTSDASDLRAFVKAAKQYSGFRYKREARKTLWQPSYHDRVLRAEEDTWSVARYIVENPLAAGLAQRVNDYPFLGSATVTKEELIRFVESAEPWRRACVTPMQS